MTQEQTAESKAPGKVRTVVCECFNAITHGVGILLFIWALLALIQKALQSGSTQELVAYIVYASSTIFLFLSSTLYHSLSFTPAEKVFQRIDHSAIYIMIAGTYTPYLVHAIGGHIGYVFLAIIWLIAIVGIVFEVLHIDKFPRLSTILYLAMGWCSLLLAKPLLENTELPAVLWLLLGGVLYSIGAFFYKQKHNPWMHVLWHLFVLVAAGAMFVSVYLYI